MYRSTLRPPRWTILLTSGLIACIASLGLGGCIIAGLIAVGGKAYEDNMPTKVFAEYHGLRDKNFAVLVAADRSVQAEFPTLVFELTNRITERLVTNAGAAGYIPPAQVVLFQSKNPGWPIRARDELARQLGGVDRLVIVEITEFRLREPGNQYLWDGQAVATVGVVEVEANNPDELVFQRSIRVGFPDQSGVGTQELGAAAVASVLLQRISDRAAWLMYDHQEPARIAY
ncbi:MAG: hypothetical protein KF866_03065 [Phycisphaeraceae bacterium]|nr:hypothetical protein [Phycisphaeraceae bacterium]MCW5753323.1 hypothetical protein [Phycisphaeraceae bacterium]